MKKSLVSLMAVLVAIAISSFTTGAIKTTSSEKKESVAGSYKWWNFNGTTIFDTWDPANYSLDENNIPDCPPAAGLIFCEIYALPSEWNPDEPDLGCISNARMRSLL